MPFLDSAFLSPSSFTVGLPPLPLASEPAVLVTVSGATLLHTPSSTPASAEAALKSLRGFRAVARRVVWCNCSELAAAPRVDLRLWGRRLVELGGAQMIVASGSGSREIAIAARDAGLPIGRVVVCPDDIVARNVLGDSINAGDTILALGVTADNCYKLATRLESRFEPELVAN
ncbi:MAG: hypothetical protein IT424_06540 [Pirellulales bacterium]|nr:hypothetical protein [Pirellulales bacterium]